MGEVVVPLLHGLGVIGLAILGGDGVWACGAGISWNRDFAFFTRGDEMTEVSPVRAVEAVFQLLIKR